MLAILAAGSSVGTVYIGFKVNQSYIAKNICINRFNPGLHCNGRCYLMKKIKQAEENEKKQAEKQGSGQPEISFFEEPVYISFSEPRMRIVITVPFPDDACDYPSSYQDAIFKPPPEV